MLAAGAVCVLIDLQDLLCRCMHGGWVRTGYLLSVSSCSVCIFQDLGSHITIFLCYELDDTQKRVTDEKDPMVHLESVYQELLSKKCPEEVQPTKSDSCLCSSLVPQRPVAEGSSLPDQEEQAEQVKSPTLPAESSHQSPSKVVIIKL